MPIHQSTGSLPATLYSLASLESLKPESLSYPSCYVLGESSLMIECTKILLLAGYEVKGLLSSDKEIKHFADESQLVCMQSPDNWKETLSLQPFDYLFSIVNPLILPDSILKLPRKLAINYHDGPLPRYAGVNVTFWAILNGERSHGITWHVMDKGIDTGYILKQSRIPLGEKETSIGLNLKCYEAAIHSFRELANELLTETIQPCEQSLEKRTYYPRNKRPARGSVINWQQGAEEIARLCRALNFGFRNNPMGLPKVVIQNTGLILSDVAVVAGPAAYPGTIVSIQESEIHLATADQLVAIRQVQTLAGDPLSPTELVARFGLYEGYCWEEISREQVKKIETLDASFARHQDYWVDKLLHFQPTMLPFYHRPGAGKLKENGLVSVPISPAVDAFLLTHTFRGNGGDFLTVVLLTYLFRISGQNSVGVGYQTKELMQSLEGAQHLFSDCLPLQIEINPKASFEENYVTFQREAATINQHQTYARDLVPRYPILRASSDRIQPHDSPIVIRRVPQSGKLLEVPANSLTLVITDQPTCTILFNPNAWKGREIETMADQLAAMLENLVSQPTLPVKLFSLFTDEIRYQLLDEWNATRVCYPSDQLIHQLVEEQVRQRPHSIAVVSGRIMLTYEELDQQANQLAHRLQKLGVGPEVMVGIYMDRSVEMIVGLLGILKAGGAYVPLDVNYPAERLQFMVEETQALCIITKEAWVRHWPMNKAQLVLLDANQEAIPHESKQPVRTEGRADNLAYVMFTSGSTGKPKGVCIPHRGVVRLVKGANYAQLDEKVTMLGMSSIAFDASTLEIWGSLANGGQLILVPQRHPSLDDLKQIIHLQKVNTLFLTTSLFHLFVEQGMEDLTTLRQLLTGGEVVSLPSAIKAFRQLPRCRIVNVYGPTENTTFTTFFEIVSDHFPCQSVPIGRPLSNTQVYILDSWMQPVPIGIPGELYTGGDGLARGYLNRESLSAEKFVANPFAPHLSPLLYKTGDQARYLPDGNIEFLGRLDNQVKIRGFRIEPGEIEKILCQHSEVREAAVTVIELGNNDKRLVAYVVVSPEATFDSSVLRAHLKEKLPEYMIPAWWVELPKMPLTANGKLDKKSLPPPAAIHKSGPPKQASTPTEQALELLWQGLLKLDSVAHQDNFFELGGNSLLAMQLLARIHGKFDLQLSIKDIFDASTIDSLGQLIDSAKTDSANQLTDIRPAPPSNQPFPLSSAQERLWIISELFAMDGTYNVPVALKLQGAVHMPALQRSLEELVRRHQILRTSFVMVNKQVSQRVNAPFSVEIPILESTGNTPVQREAEAARILEHASSQAFDLEKDRLFRVLMVQTAADTHWLLMVFHHIVCDGWSLRVLSRELSALYGAFLRHEVSPLSELSLQYTDYTHWQRQQVERPNWQKQLTYWQRHLAGMPPLMNLRLDKPRPAVQTFQGADLVFHLSLPLTQRLKKTGQASQATLFMTLLTLYKVVLHRYSQRSDIVVGTPVANRPHQQLEPLIGFFVNTLVLRTELAGAASFRELLERVRQVALDAYAHQDLPFEQLVEALNPTRSLSYPPLVQVMFALQDAQPDQWHLPGLVVSAHSLQQKTAKFDLHLSFEETAEGLQGTFNYNTDLFEPTTIEQLAHHFQRIAEEMANEPDQIVISPPFNSLSSQHPIHFPSVNQLLPDHLPSAAISAAKEIPGNPLLLASTEKLLTTIWANILKTDQVKVDDHFFEMGGNSLLAIQLVAEIRLRTGQHLPVASVFAKPTVKEMAASLRDKSNVWGSLVAVRPQGSRKPLFCVHPANGGIEYVYKLAAGLNEDQPLYGLQAVGLNGIDEPLKSIEEMAAHYLQLMLERQPAGPYQLAGYSLGGAIAYEMAWQLQQKKKEVSLLVLFDSYPNRPGQLTYFHMPLQFVLLSGWNYLSDSSIGMADKWRAIKREVSVFWQHLLNLNKRVKANEKQVAASEPDPFRVANFGARAYSSYRLKPYHGKAVFFRATDSTAQYVTKSDFGWNKYIAPAIDVYDLPGDHKAIFQNGKTVEMTAEILGKYL